MCIARHFQILSCLLNRLYKFTSHDVADVYYYAGMNKQAVDIVLCTPPISYHRVCIMVHKNNIIQLSGCSTDVN